MIVYLYTAIASVGSAFVGSVWANRDSRRSGLPRTERTTAAFALLSGLILVGVAALRWRVGVDYWQYELNYRVYSALHWSDLSLTGEPGIRVIAMVGSQVMDDPAVMFGLAALITVGLTVWTLYRHSASFPLAIALYLVTCTWQGSFNGVRQYIACAILFAGHRLIIDRQFRKYLGVVLLACLFHISAIVVLLLYLVPRRRLGPASVLVMMLLAASAISYYEAAGEIIGWLRQDDDSKGDYFYEQVDPLRIAATFAPCVVYVLLTDQKRLDPAALFYVNVLFINAALMLASAQSAYIARFAIYTGIYVALGLPAVLNMRDRGLRSIVLLAALALYLGFWWYETSSISALRNFHWIFQR